MKKYFMRSVLIMFVLVQLLQAQTVEDYLNEILKKSNAEQYMKSYLQPFSTALGTSLGGALYHRGYTKGFPRFDVGLSMTFVTIPEKAQMFDDPVSGDEMPTIFGGENGDINGFDESAFFLPVLQANLGLIANLEATARFSTLNIDYLGDLTIYGGGLKYGLSDLVPIPLIDFSAQALYHKFTLGDFMEAGTFSMNLQASVSIPVLPVDIYGGLGFDNSSLKVNTAEIPGAITPIGEISIDGENGVRFNLGASLTFLIFNVHADYNISEYNSVGGGVMIVF